MRSPRNEQFMRRFTFAAAVMLLFGTGAYASPITFDFTAVVRSGEVGNLPGGLAGDLVSGSFAYDLVGTDRDPSPSAGLFPMSALSFVATVDGTTFTSTGNTLLVVENDAPAGSGTLVDDFSFSFSSGNAPAGLTVTELDLVLENLGPGSRPPFSSDAIPSTLDLADFTTASVNLGIFNGRDTRFTQADIQTLSPEVTADAAVPESGTLVLCGVGLACLSLLRLRHG